LHHNIIGEVAILLKSPEVDRDYFELLLLKIIINPVLHRFRIVNLSIPVVQIILDALDVLTFTIGVLELDLELHSIEMVRV
jgi:hypothetical protein